MLHEEPMLAWRSDAPPGIRFAHRTGSAWSVEDVPPAPWPNQPAAPVQQGGSLSIVAVPAGVAVAGYEAIGGDLVLAVRTGGLWQVARIAGRDPTTGSDLGDMGSTVALAAGPSGDLAIAYTDRSHDRVMLAMSHAGVVTQTVVEEGLQPDPETGLGRADLIGTALAVAILPDGRAVVASQDASHLRIHLAVQTIGGSFVHQTVASLEPQLWPALVASPPGAVTVGWLALTPQSGPGGQWRTAPVVTEVPP